MPTLETTLHHYYFVTDKPEEKKAYKELRKQLEASHAGKFFNVRSSRGEELWKNKGKTEKVTLDTAFLFNNQWNETTESGNRRLFDWYEAIYDNRHCRGGHWLEITPEMEAIRRDTLTCGYCGKYVRIEAPHPWHCEKCLGSEYLKENELRLLRLLPVADSRDRNYITDAELAEILPLYKEAQGLGLIDREKALASQNRKRIAALIPKAEEKGRELLEAAKVETEAQTWLMDHELNLLDNCIYYRHTKRFCFGWRNPLTPEERSKLLDVVSEFPFDYDLK